MPRRDFMMEVFQRTSLMWRRYAPMEEQLLETVRRELPPDARVIFDAQVAAINLVQRNPDWSIIAFYRRRRGKVNWEDVPLFPRRDEFPLAAIRFNVSGQKYRSRLTCIGGHIFDFSVIPRPRSVAFREWDSASECHLLADPMEDSASIFGEAIPEAWLRLLAKGEWTSQSEWVIHELDKVYRTVVDDGDFLVLAEYRGDRFILYRLEPSPQGFFFLPAHDGTPEQIPVEAIPRFMRQ